MIDLDFEEYIRNTEPQKKEKAVAWHTAIGLQQVDGLKTSQFLLQTAKQNIEGDISIEEAQKLIDSYYYSKTNRNENSLQNTDDRTEEADKVSARIAQILGEKSFTFSPSFLIAIHKRLFTGIYKEAGVIRDYDITKKEWVLNGDTVLYGASYELKAALDYDFEQERNFSYKNLSREQMIKHLCFFVSRLWQIHAFGEGNTRTTAVFTIKYLRYLGFNADNEIFAQNSWYFRNALVRANYKNVQKNIHENLEFLEAFFRNLILNENNELKNRFCHVEYKKIGKRLQSQNNNVPVNDLVNVPVKIKIEDRIIELMKQKNTITLDEMAIKTEVSRKTIQRAITKLKAQGKIKRIGADKNGHWEVIEG